MKNHNNFITCIAIVAALTGSIQLAKAQTNTFPTTGSAGIGTTSPNLSSILEMSSTTKGMLVPRMTKTQRDAIGTPAAGLLIYQTNSTPGFYYYSGSAWTAVKSAGASKTLNNLTAPTGINVPLLPNADNTQDLGSSTASWKDLYLDGKLYLNNASIISANANNIFIGISAGQNNTTGTANVGIGKTALRANLTGNYNNAIGDSTLLNNTTGQSNVANGYQALYSNTTGTYNTATGRGSLFSNMQGSYNTANGNYTLYTNVSGNYNTASGRLALYSNTNGDENAAYGRNALYSNTTGNNNIANGSHALYSNTTASGNVAIGTRALFSNTVRSGLVAIGDSALYNNGINAINYNEGIHNIAIGQKALFANTSGYENSAVGYFSLTNNNTGYSNTACGSLALPNNNSGSENSALGYYACGGNTAGNRNTGIGNLALSSNQNGYDNTAIGRGALMNTVGTAYTSGSSNTAIGNDVGLNCITSNACTFVGAYSDQSSTATLTHATAIGYDATVNASNKMQLGSSTSTLATTGGITIVSDGRFKDNVKSDDVPGLDFIKQLQPVAYNFNYKKYDDFLTKDMTKKHTDEGFQNQLVEKGKQREVGFIAQEVDKLVSDKGYTFNGVYTPQNNNDNYALDYSRFVVPLVKAVQDLNEKLETEIEQLKSVLNPDQQKLLNQIKTTKAALEQNAPNPFNKNTVIKYSIPQKFSNAVIKIYSSQGIEMKSYPVYQSGNNEITVEANTIATGIYSYTLIVDGNSIDVKQMIVTK